MAPRTVVNGKSNAYDGICADFGDASMRTDEEWTAYAKGLLKAEMTKRGITYDQLTDKLAALGVHDTSVNIRNKVARGKFTAVFFLQCLEAVGCHTLHLEP